MNERTMRYSIFFFFLSTIFICCSNNKQEKEVVKGEVVTVHNPAKMAVNDWVLEYDTIRLEAKDDSYISEITKLEFLDDKMYIWDYKQRSIYIFSADGKFISKIADQGEGPNQYISINSFEVSPIDKEIILSDSFSKRIFVYDNEGKQLRVVRSGIYPIKIAKQKGLFINFYTGLKNVYDAFDLENNMLHFVNSDGEVQYTTLHKPQGERLDITPLRNIDCLPSGDILFHPLLDYSIYKISNGSIVTAYTLDNNSDFKFLTDRQKKKTGVEVGKRNDLEELEKEGYLLTIGNSIDLNHYLLLYAGYERRIIVGYSKNTRKSITISPLELQGDDVQKTILSLLPKAGHKDKIYIALDYLFVQSSIDKVTDNKLNTFFKNTNEMDNPVIISYKLKDF